MYELYNNKVYMAIILTMVVGLIGIVNTAEIILLLVLVFQ